MRKGSKTLLVHDSTYFKILNFKAGQEVPVHSHDIEDEVSLVVSEGEGEFLRKDRASIPARAGDVLISEIAEPRGLRATTDVRSSSSSLRASDADRPVKHQA